MGKIISVANQKGGVAKTTTTVNLAAGLAILGKKILIIDLDPQANAGSGLGMTNYESDTVYDVLINDLEPEAAIRKSAVENLYLLPANKDLSGAQVELVNMISRETKLKVGIESLKSQYDFIFIDCPPSLGLLTINAFTASDSVLIPIQCEFYALEGIAQLLKTVKLIKNSLNPDMYIEGVCLTMYSSTTNLAKEVVQNVLDHFKEKTYKSVIPRNVSISEAPSHGLPIQLYAPKSSGAIAYDKLTEEFLNNNK